MKQANSMQPKKKKTSRFRRIVIIIGGTLGIAGVIYKFISNRRNRKVIQEDVYITIGNETDFEKEIAVTLELTSINEEEESETDFALLIEDILQNELANAKKVWVINTNQEELQVEKLIFEEEGQLFLGNSNQNINLQNIDKLKYRNKIYFNRETIVQ